MVLKVYRILSFVLLPIAALFGFVCFAMLIIALANPPALLPLFLLACVVIYVFTSFIFLNKGILQAKPCKASLKDWIKVNAFVSFFFATILIWQSLTFFVKPDLLVEAYKQAAQMQQPGQSIPPYLLQKMMKGVLYFMFFFASVLLAHITITFQYLKQYVHVFD